MPALGVAHPLCAAVFLSFVCTFLLFASFFVDFCLIFLFVFYSFCFPVSFSCFVRRLLDPIPSPEERLILSQSSSDFSSVFLFLGPGTDSMNCAGIRSYTIRCSLCARNSRTLGSQLHSDFDLFSFRDCQEKVSRIMVAEQC